MTTLAYRERRPGRRFLRGLLLVAAGLWMTGLIPAPADAAPEDVLDHYLFYLGKRCDDECEIGPATPPKYPSFGSIRLHDPLYDWTGDYKVVKGRRLGLPAAKNFEVPLDLETHLKKYKIKGPRGFERRVDVLHNQCGDEWVVEVIRPVSLLVPSSKGHGDFLPPPDPGSHNVDHFLCYKVRLRSIDPITLGPLVLRRKKPQVTLADQFRTDTVYDLKSVFEVCNPVNKSEVPGEPATWLKGPFEGLPVDIEPATIKNPGLRLLGFRVRVAQKTYDQEPIPPIPSETPSCRCQEQSPGRCVTGVSDPKDVVLAHPRPEVFTNNQFGVEQDLKNQYKKAIEFYIPSSPSGAFLDAGTALLD